MEQFHVVNYKIPLAGLFLLSDKDGAGISSV